MDPMGNQRFLAGTFVRIWRRFAVETEASFVRQISEEREFRARQISTEATEGNGATDDTASIAL